MSEPEIMWRSHAAFLPDGRIVAQVTKRAVEPSPSQVVLVGESAIETSSTSGWTSYSDHFTRSEAINSIIVLLEGQLPDEDDDE